MDDAAAGPGLAQDVEDFVLAGGSLLTIHNSLWGYPIGPRAEAEPEAMMQELREVQQLLSGSSVPMTTQQAGVADPARLGPYANCKINAFGEFFHSKCRDNVKLPLKNDDFSLKNGTLFCNRRYRRACGGVGGYHPVFERQSVHVVDPEHPITAGVSDFQVHDEQHYVFFDAHLGARMFLKNRGSDGRESCAGFTYQHGAGRVCYLAPGHVPLASQPGMELPPGEPDAISHPMVQRLFMNAVSWLAGEATEAGVARGIVPQPPRDLRLLSKAHLHLHLEGAMRPATLIDLLHPNRSPSPRGCDAAGDPNRSNRTLRQA